MREVKILYKGGQGEYVEKRSKFIANLIPVSSEFEATEEIEKLRKKFYDARHNCYAYVVFGDEGVVERSSDDGEPSGTAGKPMLDILTGNQIYNILAVVTRYFGGTLLGTGGLVRAYSTAVKEALESCELMEVYEGEKVHINLDYTDLNKVQNLMRKMDVLELSNEYGNNVSLDLVIPRENIIRFNDELREMFAGKEKSEDEGEVRYAVKNGGGKEIILL